MCCLFWTAERKMRTQMQEWRTSRTNKSAAISTIVRNCQQGIRASMKWHQEFWINSNYCPWTHTHLHEHDELIEHWAQAQCAQNSERRTNSQFERKMNLQFRFGADLKMKLMETRSENRNNTVHRWRAAEKHGSAIQQTEIRNIVRALQSAAVGWQQPACRSFCRLSAHCTRLCTQRSEIIESAGNSQKSIANFIFFPVFVVVVVVVGCRCSFLMWALVFHRRYAAKMDFTPKWFCALLVECMRACSCCVSFCFRHAASVAAAQLRLCTRAPHTHMRINSLWLTWAPCDSG